MLQGSRSRLVSMANLRSSRAGWWLHSVARAYNPSRVTADDGAMLLGYQDNVERVFGFGRHQLLVKPSRVLILCRRSRKSLSTERNSACYLEKP